jgi:oxygen-dependent protoporphyrinogen oxidase
MSMPRLEMGVEREPRSRIAVVGGGIAGLSAARELLIRLPGAQVTVYESSSAVGGKLRVGEVAGQTVDFGAETMLARRPEATELVRKLGLAGSLVEPATTSAGIWTGGAVRPIPPGLMGVPANPGAAVRSGLLSPHAGRRASIEPRLRRLRLEEDVAIGTLVARRLGRAVRDRIVEPLLGGVYAGHSDALSAFAAAPQLVAGAREHGSLLAAARATTAAQDESPVFAGLVGGVGRLANALAEDVRARAGVVRCGATVRDLRRRPGGWDVVVGSTRDAELVTVDGVVLACPATPAARLIRPASAAAAAPLAALEYASMAVVVLAFDQTEGGVELTGSGFLVPPIDKTAIKAATYSSRKWDWMAQGPMIVRCSVGRHGEESTLQHDDATLVEAAALDVRDAVGITAPLLDARVVRWGGALPQYAVGHLDRVAAVRRAVVDLPGLAVCGAAFDGIGIPACIASAHAAASHIVDEVTAVRRLTP